MNDSKYIKLQKDIDTGYASHCMLSELATTLNGCEHINIAIDLSKLNFIAGNQLAILGCILSTYKKRFPNNDILISLPTGKLKTIMQKSGFSAHLGMEKVQDTFNTVIPYSIFKINQIDEYKEHISTKIFNRKDIPKMSPKVRSLMLDNILELFNNVKEHTSSKEVYTCGQFFPKSNYLYLTVVDAGETIPYNVNKYFEKFNESPPGSRLSWAMESGNSTRITETPGGLGLSFLEDFIRLNKGKLYIVSGNETYERIGRDPKIKYMQHPFPGTIITVAFNMSDSSSYSMASEVDFNEIIF